MKFNNEQKHNKKLKVISNLFLIFTTILWGTTFIITKTLTQDIPIFLYLGLRYLLGTIGFIPLFFHFKNLFRRIFETRLAISSFMYQCPIKFFMT